MMRQSPEPVPGLVGISPRLIPTLQRLSARLSDASSPSYPPLEK